MSNVGRNLAMTDRSDIESDRDTVSSASGDADRVMSFRPGDSAWTTGTEGFAKQPCASHGGSDHDPSTVDARHDPDGSDRQSLILARTIDNDIIPRLLQAHRTDKRKKTPSPAVQSMRDVDDTLSFASFVIANDEPSIHAAVTARMARGLLFDDICLDLLAPTARHLGDFWWNDTCSFLDVTLALCKLQHVLRDLGDLRDDAHALINPTKSILLTAPVSNQHMFGYKMVEDFFRRADWSICGLPGASLEEMVIAVRRDRFAVLGLSVGCEDDMPKLARLVATLRAASRNRSIVVLVGGPSFTDRPEQASLIGADATAGDARQAVAQAECLITSMKRN